MNKKTTANRLLALLLSLIMVLGVMPMTALASPQPIIAGNSVYRASAESTTVRFISDNGGTAYYKITESEAPPSTEDLSLWTAAGAVTAGVTKALTLTAASGAKYVHIVLQSGEVLSNVLTLSLPSNYCYSEDFEAHPLNTYVAQSGSPLTPISQKHGGTGNANQKVASASDNNFLSLSSNSAASMQTISLPVNYREGASSLVLKGKVMPLSEGNYHEAALFGIGDRKNGVLFINGKICFADKKDINNITYSFNRWYEIELDVDLLTNKYDIKIDGETVAADVTYYDSDRYVTMFAGHNTTAYFDDLCLYIQSEPHTPDYTPRTITGGSVYRTSAESATIRFLADKSGTAYYKITESESTPTEDLSLWTNAGEVAAEVTKTLTLTTTSGAKYVHIVVKNGDTLSNVLTVSMPSDYCYSENFDSYPLNTYVAQNNGELMSPMSQINNGTGNYNQKVANGVGTNGTRILSLSSDSSWASNQVVVLDKEKLRSANSYVFEGDVYVQSTEAAWQARFSVTNGSYENESEAGIFFKNGKILAIKKSWPVLAEAYTANQWHHVKLIMDPDAEIYAVYFDGELLASDLALPHNIDRLAFTAGHGKTAYYDNFVFYTSEENLPRSIEHKTVTVSDTVYNGNEQRQPVVIEGLVEGTDFDVTYSDDCTNAGVVTVTVTGKGNYFGTLTLTYNIAKCEQTAPDAPEAENVGKNSITLIAVEGCEYSMDGTAWQDSPVFEGLTVATSYTFYQRYKETANYEAGTASSAAISTHVHYWATQWSKDNTHHWHGCTVCNDVDGYTPHSFDQTTLQDETTFAEAATCTRGALYKYTCICGEIGTETHTFGDPLGHDYTAQVTEDRYKRCDASCTGSAEYYFSCTRCGESCEGDTNRVFTAGDPLGHDYTAQITEDRYKRCDASCTGSAEYYFSCTRCGESCEGDTNRVFAAGNAAGHTDEIIPAVEATCTATGLTEGKKCSVCGEVTVAQKSVAKKAHSYKTTTTKATTSKDGSTVKKCTVCGTQASKTAIYKASSIKLSTTSYTYNGSVKTPSVTVKDSKGKTLKKDTDYTVKYASGRKSVGKYTITVTLKGKYSGTKSLSFTINPKATSKITVTQTTTSIKATWSKVSGATGYKVYIYKGSKLVASKTVSAKTTSYNFTKLTAGTNYTVKVKAYQTVSKVNYWSSTKSLATATKTKTPSITSLKAGSKSATVKWSNVSGENGYQVYYATSKNGTYKKGATTKANDVDAIIKSLTKGKTYYFKVRAYKTADSGTVYSAWSAVKSVKVK